MNDWERSADGKMELTDIVTAHAAWGIVNPHPSRMEGTARETWRPDAAATYAGFEDRLPSCDGFADVRWQRFSTTLIPADSIPSTWWDHLKLTVRERWPRVIGWLTVRWRR